MCTPGGDLSPLELADVNRDGLRDVLLSFVTTRNGTEGGKRYIWRLPRGRCQPKDSFPGTVRERLCRPLVTTDPPFVMCLIRKSLR